MPVDAVGVGLGLAKTVTGLVNDEKAKSVAKTLAATRPKLGSDTIADNNLALAESDLGNNGLDAASKKAFEDLNNNQFSNSVASVLKAGGNANNIGALYGENAEGRERLATLNSDLRLKQIQNLIETSKPVEERTKEQFAYNVDAPWKDAAQANAAARAGAQNQIWSGIDTIGGAAMGAAQDNKEDKLFAKYFGLGTPTVTQTKPTINYNPPPDNTGVTGQNQGTSFNAPQDNSWLWSNPNINSNNNGYTPQKPVVQPLPNNNTQQPVNISNPNGYGFFNFMRI